MTIECVQCIFRRSCGQSIKECREHHGGKLDESISELKNVTSLLNHFPFNTKVFVYTSCDELIFNDIKGRLSQCTDSWKRKLVNEWEVDEDGVHIWIGD